MSASESARIRKSLGSSVFRSQREQLRASALRAGGARFERAATLLLVALVCTACQAPEYGRSEELDGVGGGARTRDAGASAAGSAARDASDLPTRDGSGDAAPFDAGTGPFGSNAVGARDGASGSGSSSQPDSSGTTMPADGTPVGVAPGTNAVPSWAMPLLGRYATRWFTFRQDEFGTVVRAEQLAIVEFALDGAGMTLRSKFCLSTGDSGVAQLRLVDPSALPERSERVVFSELERSWASDGATYATGFMPEQPPFCAGKAGQSVPKTMEQAWLTSTCRCSGAGEAPLLDDCRILDPDHDKHPGVSYTLKGFTSSVFDRTLYAASETDSHYVAGTVGGDGAPTTANVAVVERNYQLGCAEPSCGNIAVLGKACPVSWNHAFFVALAKGDPTSCADLAANVNALFPGKAPELLPCFQQ